MSLASTVDYHKEPKAAPLSPSQVDELGAFWSSAPSVLVDGALSGEQADHWTVCFVSFIREKHLWEPLMADGLLSHLSLLAPLLSAA